MTSQNAQKTANDKMPEKPKEVATVQINTGPKSFFEEILDKTKWWCIEFVTQVQYLS